MKSRDLRRLLQVAEAGFTAARARLDLTRSEEAGIRQQLEGLSAARQAAGAADRSKGDPALAAGADARWHRWIASRKAQLNGDLAAIMVRKSTDFDRLKTAFGRKRAIADLLARVEKQNRHQQERRAADQTS